MEEIARSVARGGVLQAAWTSECGEGNTREEGGGGIVNARGISKIGGGGEPGSVSEKEKGRDPGLARYIFPEIQNDVVLVNEGFSHLKQLVKIITNSF